MSFAIGRLPRSRTVLCCPAVLRTTRSGGLRGRSTPIASLKAENLQDQTRKPCESFGEFSPCELPPATGNSQSTNEIELFTVRTPPFAVSFRSLWRLHAGQNKWRAAEGL